MKNTLNPEPLTVPDCSNNMNILEKIKQSSVPYLSKIDFDPGKLAISQTSLAKFMGYTKDIPEPLAAVFDDMLDVMPGKLKLAGAIRISNNIKVTDNSFYSDNVFFDTGRIISRNLSDSEFLAFFMVTAGIELDRWSVSAFKEENYLLGYSIDCAGSEIAEELADEVERQLLELSNDNQSKQVFISNRYSPGYCGWNVSEQKKLFSLFPENYCGITLTDSSLMIPVKSISGVIALGNKIKRADYQCNNCENDDCIRKKHLL